MADFSDNDYDSDSNKSVWDHKTLCAIFDCDNVNFLKQALKDISPRQICEIIGVDLLILSPDKYENSSLPRDSIKCFKYLVKRGMDINIRDQMGCTPLYYACKYNPRAIRYILRKGGDPNAKNIGGETPIKRYITYRFSYKEDFNLEIIREAIDLGFDVKSVDSRGITCLRIDGCINYDERFISLLDLFIQNGFDINTKDNNGNTFLHGISLLGSRIDEDSFVQLYKRGFDFNIKNNEGLSVIDSFRAVPNKIEEIRELLQKLKEEEEFGESIKEPEKN